MASGLVYGQLFRIDQKSWQMLPGGHFFPDGQPEQATANLRAPLVVNLRRRKGKQLILNESIPLRFSLLSEGEEGVQADVPIGKETASV